MQIIAILASIASVAAFAPARIATKATGLKMAFESEIGALKPFGFWDPLGLAKDIDQDTFDRYREVEVKHGRVAMLAVIGYIVPEYTKFAGELAPGLPFADIPNGVAAIGVVPSFGWLQLIASIGYWELVGWEVTPGGKAFEFGWGEGFLGQLKNPLEGETKREYQTKEIQNGRLAMIGIGELLTHDLAKTGEPLLYLHHF